MIRITLLSSLLFLLLAAPLGAEIEPKIGLHLKRVSGAVSGTCTDLAPQTVSCSQFETRGKVGQAYYAYLIGAQAESIAGLSCGIEYDYRRGEGVDVFSWTFCGDAQWSTPEWPASGAGNRMVWDYLNNCQNHPLSRDGAHAVAGAFYLYAYSNDLFAVTPHQKLLSGPELVVLDCALREFDLPLTARGALRFSDSGQEFGYNPCSGVGEVPPPPRPPDPLPPPTPPPPPPAGDQEAAFLLHVESVSGRAATCEGAPGRVQDIVTSAPVPSSAEDYTVYFLAAPAYQDGVTAGLLGVRTGIGVDIPSGSPGIEILEWTKCSTGGEISLDGWPAPNSGVTVTWVGCRTGGLEVVGFFRVRVRGPGALLLKGYPTDGAIRYAACSGGDVVYTPLSEIRAGWVSLGGASLGTDSNGCNPILEPCPRGAVPIRVTTWGRIKSLY